MMGNFQTGMYEGGMHPRIFVGGISDHFKQTYEHLGLPL